MRIVEITNTDQRRPVIDPATGQPTTASADLPRTITIPHNGEIYSIPPGASKIVPYDAAASLFGDPRARDTEKDKARRETFEHVRAMHNYHLGWHTETKWDQELEPKFTAIDVNDQQEVWFVVQDPDGAKTFNVPAHDGLTDQLLTAQLLAELQQQVARLSAQVAARPDAPSSSVAPEIEAPNEVEITTEPVGVGAELPPTPATEPAVTKDGPRVPPTGKSK